MAAAARHGLAGRLHHRPTGALKLDRVLATAAGYPGDYGLVPQTLDTDGDPVNVLVMTNLPTFPGCIIEARPLGVFRMLDGGLHDDKVLAVLAHDPFFAGYQNYTDLPAHYLKEVEHFFTVYKDLDGSRVEPQGWDAVAATKRGARPTPSPNCWQPSRGNCGGGTLPIRRIRSGLSAARPSRVRQ